MSNKFLSLRPFLSSLFSFVVIASLCLMPTLRVTAQIAGDITYGNVIGNPPGPRNVKNVLVESTVGTPYVSFTTVFPSGSYTLSGYNPNVTYTITPSKPGGTNGAISSFDAARIAQHVTGSVLLTGNQLVVADLSGNNTINSLDAAKLAQYVAALPFSPPNFSGTWRFYTVASVPFPPGATPMGRTYLPTIPGSVPSQDYTGLLMGEITGNWNPAIHPRPAKGTERSTAVSLPSLVTPADNEVLIPVSIQGAANKGIISYEFDLRYDPSVIKPQENPVDVAGTVSRGLSVVTNANEPGHLRVVMYGPMAIDENGLLLNLRFTAVGDAGSVSPLTWERIMFNEGNPQTIATDGRLELSAAVSN
ncbi:MAG: cohesin domain-containing protein [Pyrinomonadaceae bacterium]